MPGFTAKPTTAADVVQAVNDASEGCHRLKINDDGHSDQVPEAYKGAMFGCLMFLLIMPIAILIW